MVPIAILLAIWSVRVYRKCLAWCRDKMFNPGLAAASWFIPLGNLVLPAVMVTNAWKASDPTLPIGATSADAGERSTSPLIGAWWACWLATLLVQILFGATATVRSGDSVRVYRDHLERQVTLAGLGAALTVAAAVLGADGGEPIGDPSTCRCRDASPRARDSTGRQHHGRLHRLAMAFVDGEERALGVDHRPWSGTLGERWKDPTVGHECGGLGVDRHVTGSRVRPRGAPPRRGRRARALRPP